MTNFEKALDNLSERVKDYRQLDEQDGYTLNVLLQDISGTLFYLEKHRAEYHKKFQDEINSNILSGTSATRAENLAHVKYPEMYMLRRIMDAGYEVIGAIRSNISSLNKQRID